MREAPVVDALDSICRGKVFEKEAEVALKEDIVVKPKKEAHKAKEYKKKIDTIAKNDEKLIIDLVSPKKDVVCNSHWLSLEQHKTDPDLYFSYLKMRADKDGTTDLFA